VAVLCKGLATPTGVARQFRHFLTKEQSMIRYAPGLGPLEIQGTGGVLNMEEFEMYFAFSMFFLGFSQIPSSDPPPPWYTWLRVCSP